jgi:hypothetical protein
MDGTMGGFGQSLGRKKNDISKTESTKAEAVFEKYLESHLTIIYDPKRKQRGNPREKFH